MIQNSAQLKVQLLRICYQMITWKKIPNVSGSMTSGQYPGNWQYGKGGPFERSRDICAAGFHTVPLLKGSVNSGFAGLFLNMPVQLIFFLNVPVWGTEYTGGINPAV